MDFSNLSTTQLVIIIAAVLIVIAGVAIWLSSRKSRTNRLRTQFGGAEYSRTLQEGGNQRKAEAALDQRAERVDAMHIRPLAPGDRARFLETWGKVQSHFVDSPGGAVIEADQLLGDVMSTRGYPVSDFEQRVADISVDHPLVLDNYRVAHHSALRQARGQASTEELRQAMIHFRTLFEDLLGQTEAARA